MKALSISIILMSLLSISGLTHAEEGYGTAIGGNVPEHVKPGIGMQPH